MSFLEAIVLGAVQGATEFIPVSSSGHLVILHALFGEGSYDLSLDALLQLATALAVLVYFRREIFRLVFSLFRLLVGREVEVGERRLLGALFLGTIPAVVLGLLLEDKMETVFRSVNLVALMLFAGSLLMFVAEKIQGPTLTTNQGRTLNSRKGFFIGLFQALALIPGVSRSGATISGGLFMGLSREEATRFSFLLSFPIIAGSGLKKLFELNSAGVLEGFGMPLIASLLVSFLIGLWVIDFLLKYLKNHTLNLFVAYRIALAVTILLIS